MPPQSPDVARLGEHRRGKKTPQSLLQDLTSFESYLGGD
jgi:hypothetical protein